MSQIKEGRLLDDDHSSDTPAKAIRRRAAELVQQDNETILKLENAAIERSKAVDSAVLGKYNIWRKEIENDNPDSDLPQSAPEKIKTMRQVLSKAREQLYDCKFAIGKLRAMLQTSEEQVRSLKKTEHVPESLIACAFIIMGITRKEGEKAEDEED
ncbi:hypothetical protein V6N13_099202 [Hibiscus sabdariffa]